MESEEEESSILYDLNVLLSWSEEQDESDIRSQLQRHPFATSSWSHAVSKRLSRWLGRSTNVSDVFERLHSLRPPVLIASSPQADLLLMLQSGSRLQLLDATAPDLDPPLLSLTLPQPEQFPQWLRAAWSDCGSHFAVSGPTLGVVVYSVKGALVHSWPRPEDDSGRVVMEDAVVTALAFTHLSGSALRVVAVSYSSLVTVYGPESPVSFRLSDRAPMRVLCGEGEGRAGVLALGTTSFASPVLSAATQHGLLLLRFVNSPPYLVLTMAGEEDLCKLQRRPLLARLTASDAGDAVVTLSISPDARRLAALHTSGAVTLWSFPSGQLLATRLLKDQVFHEALSPILAEKVFSWARRLLPCLPSNRPTGLTWWDEESLVVARENGSVAVWSPKFQSRTGDRPQWFEPYVSVSGARGRQFLVLEHDSRRCTGQAREEEEGERMAAVDSGEEEEEEEEEEENAEDGFLLFALRRGGVALKRALGWAGAEAGAAKRAKMADTGFRLLRFAWTTPEQLFQSKIDAEEYGEALGLSRRYPGRLDPDLVFQRQWQRSMMSRAAIEDFLVRISKHSWVLHECLERCPDDIDSARHLLMLGLRATDVDAFLEPGPKLVLTDTTALINDEPPPPDGRRPTVQEERAAERRAAEAYRRRRLQDVRWTKLSLRQQELMRQRRRLLAFVDQLDAFEEILGGPHRAPDRFNGEAFTEFRGKDPLAAAVKYARDGNYTALEILLTFFQPLLRPHWLLLLANIPETEDPRSYSQLLPQTGDRLDQPEVLPWDPTNSRDPDWAEEHSEDPVAAAVEATAAELYTAFPDYRRFRTDSLSQSLLRDWFSQRANEIERGSAQVSCAAELLRLGAERLEGLDDHLTGLSLLETLVYECGAAHDLRLYRLEALSPLEVARLMLANCEPAGFVRAIRRWVLPFLERRERQATGDGRWATLAPLLGERSLGEVRALFEALARDELKPLLTVRSPEQLRAAAGVAVDCCYAVHPDADRQELAEAREAARAVLEAVCRLFEERGAAGDEPQTLMLLGRHIDGAKTLGKLGAERPLAFFRSREAEDPESVAAMLRGVLARAALPGGAASGRESLKMMMKELKRLLRTALPCLHPDRLTRFLVEALLNSGEEKNLRMAANFLTTEERSGREQVSETLSFEESAQVIASSSRHFFDVALSSSHPSMDAARRCLSLLTAPHPCVLRERRLIDAFQLLESLGADLLPAELRAASDRRRLLHDLLQRRPHLRRAAPDAVMALGDALGLDHGSAALRELAAISVEAGDSEKAAEFCQRLLEAKERPVEAWREMESAVRIVEDGGLRRRLRDFVLAFCPPGELGRVAGEREEEEEEGKGRRKRRREATPKLHPFCDVDAKSQVYSEMEEEEEPEEGRELRRGKREDLDDDSLDALLVAAAAACRSESSLFVALAAQISSPAALDSLLDACFTPSESSLRLSLRAVLLSLSLHPPSDSPPLPGAPLSSLPPPAAHHSAAQLALESKYRSSLTDVVHRRRLAALRPDIDLQRFSSDPAFRTSTALSLSRTVDASCFSFALELAERHGMSASDLRLERLSFLLTSSPLPAATAAAGDLVEAAGASAARAALSGRIWAALDGVDHVRLDLLLSLLPADCEVEGKAAGDHRALLKKLRSSAPAVNYKALLSSSPASVLSALERHLSAGNVHVLAKAAPQLGLASESVFAAWVGRLWAAEKPGESWRTRFDACRAIFPRLTADGLVGFVRDAVFAQDSRLGSDERREMVRAAADFCSAAPGGGRRSKRREGATGEWRAAETRLEEFVAHLERVEALRPRLGKLGGDFGLLPPGPGFLEELLAQLLAGGAAPAAVAEVAAEMGDEGQLGPGLRRAAQQIVVSALGDPPEAKRRLEKLLGDAAEVEAFAAPLLDAVEALLAEPDIRARLGNFLIAQLRRFGGGGDAVTRAVVAQALLVLSEAGDVAGWEEAALGDGRRREEKVGAMIDAAEEPGALMAVHEALSILQHLNDDAEKRLWRRWVARVAHDFPEAMGEFVVTACEGEDEERIAEALEAFTETAPLVALRLAALSTRDEAARAMPALLERQGVAEAAGKDDRLVDSILNSGRFHLVVHTDMARACVDRLVAHGGRKQVRTVAAQLRRHGAILEAAAILAESEQLHPALRTMSALAEMSRRLKE